MKKIISTGVTLIAASLAFQPAIADPGLAMEESSTRVIHADLNLATQAGLDTLNRRVRSAARSLCERSGAPAVAELVRARQCVTKALSGAELQIAQAVGRLNDQRYAAASSIRLAVKK